jgi:very-short-patch-repair endonuclease
MPPRAHRPTALAWQVFRGSDAVRRGLLTEHQLRSKAWVRLRHNVYADARLERDHALACQAVALRLPPDAVIAGPSAAYMHGVEHAAGFADDVHVLVPQKVWLGSQQGLRVHSTDQTPLAVQPGSAPSRTSPPRTAWETAVWLDPVRAVGIVDALLRRRLVAPQDLVDIASENINRPGARRARRVFDLADPGAESPPESHLRVRLVMGGLPRPVTQHPVAVPSGLVLHPDLAWPSYKVAVEYDGSWHADSDHLHLDRQRLNHLVGAGWLVLHVTSGRLRNDFPGVLREVRSALVSRGWRP